MINEAKTFELLGEIAKLLRKYGKETFLELATILRDPSLLNQVAASLEDIANRPVNKKSIQKRPSASEEGMRFRESLVDIGEFEPEKSQILLSLFDSLHNKTILPSLRELIDFFSDSGLPVNNSRSRGQVIISFMKYCKNLSLSELQRVNLSIGQRQTMEDADRSLSGWGEIILKSQDKKIDSNKQN